MKSEKNCKVLIVGAGFSGAVVAEQLSKSSEHISITVIDSRSHIGGNCYSEREPDTNIMVHKYGPHIFHTDKVEVWNYINQFCTMIPFINRVKSIYKDKVYSLPINLHTINQFFDKCFSPAEAKAYIEEKGKMSGITEPNDFEEQALKFIGEDLYKAFFYGYTKKQWGCEPKEIPASVLKRLPVRFNYNDNYFNCPYQGIPKDGYTAIFEKMLDHDKIDLQLNTKFDSYFDASSFDHIFYTGPIDAFFEYKYGRLGYRTVYFEKKIQEGDFQGNAIVNYADSNVPFTRIHEHKHFAPWESHSSTVYFREYSKETDLEDEPYYPKRLQSDMEIFNSYWAEVEKLSNITFIGRLATYRYMDMHNVIDEALETAKKFIDGKQNYCSNNNV